MLAMKKELLVSLADIEAVCVICSSCKSQVRVATGAPLKAPADVQGSPVPLKHCSCGLSFGDGLRGRVDALRTAIENMAGSLPVITLQVNADAIPSNQ
jgi:hypothetical protein